MFRSIKWCLPLLAGALGVSGQTPHFTADFNKPATYRSCAGVAGQALDLGRAAASRQPLVLPYVLKGHAGAYSVQCWVKAEAAQSRYTALEATGEAGGWKLGVQENGAWFWELRQGSVAYAYQPTAARQNIRDGKWHQLTYTYDAAKQEAALYYDGRQMAIYFAEGTAAAQQADTLFAGGGPQGDIGEWATFAGAIDEVKIYRDVLGPAAVAASYAAHRPLRRQPAHPEGKQLTVMNFNIWHGGNETGKDAGPGRVVDIIRTSGADIVSMQETYGSGEKIADALGYYFYLRSSNLSIMSRYPITETTPGSRAFFNGGVRVRLSGSRQVVFVTNWLSYPFDYWDMLEKGQPLQTDTLLAKMEIHNAAQLRKSLAVLQGAIDSADHTPVIFCGDFNSGSHLDWTEAAKHFNHGYVVPFPQSLIMYRAGFTDSYRAVHPDPVRDRGITWSPAFPNAFKDRIDYIYYRGKHLKAEKSYTITTHPVRYPSDHAALVTVFRLL